MKTFSYKVRRGPETGVTLHPHRYRDGCFRVSMTRFEQDQIVVRTDEEIAGYLEQGYGLRMSNPESSNHRAPSLIHPKQIRIAVR